MKKLELRIGRRTRSLFTIFSIAAVTGCGGTPTVSRVNQMHTMYSDVADRLDEAGTWSILPRSVVIMTTTEESTITVLFVAESVGAKKAHDLEGDVSEPGDHDHAIGDIGITGPNGNHVHTVESSVDNMTPVEVRILIDDEETFPPSAQFIGNPLTGNAASRFATHSFLAFIDGVSPGTHVVRVEWRSARAGAFVRNRTLTVWETVSRELPTERPELEVPDSVVLPIALLR